MTRATWEPPEYPVQVREALSHVLDEWAERVTDVLFQEWGASGLYPPPRASVEIERAFKEAAQRLYDASPDRDLNRDWMWHHLDTATRLLALKRSEA